MPNRLACFKPSPVIVIVFTLALLCGFFAIGISTSLAQGQPAGAGLVPKGINGYTVSVDRSWVSEGVGFRPIRVTVETNPSRAVVEEERFSIELESRLYSNGRNVVATELVIPAGQKSGMAEIYALESAIQNSYRNDVTIRKIGGRFLVSDSQGSRNSWSEMPKVLVISDEFPASVVSQTVCYTVNSPKTVTVNQSTNLSEPKTPLPSFGYMIQAVHQNYSNRKKFKPEKSSQSWSNLRNTGSMHYSRFADLPLSWIGLEGIDQIFISLKQLEALTKSSELQRANLEKWIIAGGVLIVSDTGPEFKKADQIWPMLMGSERDFANDRSKSRWRVPNKKISALRGLINPKLTGSNSNANQWLLEGNYPSTDIEFSKWAKHDSPADFPKKSQFGIRKYLSGAVVAVDSDMSDWTPPLWKDLHNSIFTTCVSISHRVSTSELGAGRYDFDFAIPGVGEPPVKSFQVLIGLFLLIAGPIMILVLKRSKQMQYLFVAVPMLSAAVCSSLLLYAAMVDGSNSWGRCQSVTYLDHQAEMAVTYSRATYYSGKHPGAYRLPVDGLGVAFSQDNQSRTDYKDGQMVLSEGSISARIPHQVATTRPYQTVNRLLVIPSESKKETGKEDSESKSESLKQINAPKIQNRLGADVKLALVRTEQGYFFVENLKNGQTTLSRTSDIASQVIAIRKLATKLSPQLVGSRRRNRNYYTNYVSDQSNIPLGEDCHIVSLLRTGGVENLLDRPNTYVALLEDLPMAAEQLEPVQYKMQLHVVRGQW